LITFTLGSTKAGILQDPNLISVSVYEMTDGPHVHTFLKNDQRLTTDTDQNPPEFASDFLGAAEEHYDVFISNGDGELDAGGDFVTIECYFDAIYPGCRVGNNIDAVSLNYADGTVNFAEQVSSLTLGINGDPATRGKVMNALSRTDQVCTYMGCHYSRMTLEFPSAGNPVVHIQDSNGEFGNWIDTQQFSRSEPLDGVLSEMPVPCRGFDAHDALHLRIRK
jgi:hypothetical protein